MRLNPFESSDDRTGLPKKIFTDFKADDGEYIVEYNIIQKVKKLGEKDTDFVIINTVEETNRINRQEYINSFRQDVGILNIIEKVRLSGDVTLLNQSHRVGYGASGEVDSLGRDLEPVVDVIKYQVDPVEGIEIIKQSTKIPGTLDPELTDGLSFEGLANLSDEQIDAYLAKKKDAILAARKAAEDKKGE